MSQKQAILDLFEKHGNRLTLGEPIIKEYLFRGKVKRAFFKFKKTCPACGNSFMARLKTGKYCSQKCTTNYRKKRKFVSCLICKCPIETTTGRDPKFCSVYCKGKFQVEGLLGDKNPHWRGGSFIRPDGYRAIKVGRKYRMEHVLTMENHLGRKLAENEIVHHINKNKLDNRLSNLMVMNNREHLLMHAQEFREENAGYFKENVKRIRRDSVTGRFLRNV